MEYVAPTRLFTQISDMANVSLDFSFILSDSVLEITISGEQKTSMRITMGAHRVLESDYRKQ